VSIRNTRWLPLQDKFNIDPKRKKKTQMIFFFETTEPFDSKLYGNIPWIVLYKMSVFV
jgi:hypothetical protein